MAEVTQQEEEGGGKDQFHGDILEAILFWVPLIDLTPATQVSKSWNQAALSLLRRPNTLKPWLLVHIQSTRSPYVTTTHAYDPRSRAWIDICQSSTRHVSALRSSNSNFAYVLSPSKLSFSSDPLHLTWHHANGPLVWRMDPIVAHVGHRIVVAGGACDFENDPLAVEIYDLESRTWETSDFMPSVLKDSAASTWLSVANDDLKLYVTEKCSGVTHWFDPETKIWYGPYDLHPDASISHSIIGFAGNHLILIGLITDGGNKLERLKLWEVNRENFECEEVAEMPPVLVEKLNGETFEFSSIGVCLAGNMVYIYNPSEPGLVFGCEMIINSGEFRWWSVENPVATGWNKMNRFVFTCSEVGLDDLQRAMSRFNRRFEVNTYV